MKFVKHVLFVFLVTSVILSPVLFAGVSMEGVARETYGTGETGAFFFVGKEHIYADDLMRMKLGVPLHPSRKGVESAESDSASSAHLDHKSVSGPSFGAVAQRDVKASSQVSRKHRVQLKDSSSL